MKFLFSFCKMRYISLSALFILFFYFVVFTGISQPVSPKEIIYAGSFSKMGKPGLYVFEFDRVKGKLNLIQTVDDGASPNFLAVHRDKKFLYAIYDRTESSKNKEGMVVSYKIDAATGKLSLLNEQSANGSGPAHISVDPKGRFIYVSNYGGGSLSVYAIQQDGKIGKTIEVIQDTGKGPHPNQNAPHVHSAIPSPDGDFLYVCDLGIDKIFTYQVREDGRLVPGKIPSFSTDPGTGPRQFAVSPDGDHAFAVLELVSQLVSFKRNKKDGTITLLQTLDMLPAKQTERGSDATVFVSPDNRFVYATNWGPFGILAYYLGKNNVLSPVQQISAHGLHPRDICIDEKGKYIFVANMGSGDISVMRRNSRNGRLTFLNNDARVPAVSCIVQVFLR